MKLNSLTVHNFRSLNGAGNTITFDSADIIFIFGQNDVGKSSFLRAYEYFVAPKKKVLISDFYNFNLENKISMEAVFIKEDGDDDYFDTKGFNRWVSQENTLKFRKTWTSLDTEGQKETFLPGNDEYTKDGFGGIETYFAKVAPTPISIPAMPTPSDLEKWVSDVLKKQILKSLSEDSSTAYQEAINKIKVLQSEIENRELLQSYASNANNSFQKVFPELELSIATSPDQKIDISKALEKEFNVTIQKNSEDQEGDNKSTFNSHGHGVVRQAMFNFLGLSGKNFIEDNENPASKEYIILFEEPELYLHPKRIRLLRETLYNLCTGTKFQMLCASHNPQLIDLSKPHTTLARIVNNEDNTTSIHQVGDDAFDAEEYYRDRILMLNRFNPHVCETFFSDEVVLVEGDTEAIVFRTLLELHHPTKDIFVLNTGTKNNMPFFIDILTHFRIKQHIIHDSDCRYQYSNGVVVLNANGTPRANSAWTLNASIWNKIVKSNALQEGLCKRYVSVKNFEDAHDYTYNQDKGKPLSAYEFSQGLSIDSDAPIINFLQAICGETPLACTYSPADLESRVIEEYQENEEAQV